jgi:ABC-type sugar transport system ATPase subunit
MSEPILQFEHVSKSFFGAMALHDVTLAVRPGSVLGLVGENGAGKSTLMNILGGVIAADEGQIRLKGKPYSAGSPANATRAGVAFIHQELNLFSHLSIVDTLFIDGFPRIGWTPLIHRREAVRRAKEALVAVNLRIAPRTRVDRLTPGQKQLVEIAKALQGGAQIIIFDEPTTSLTSRETERLFALIERLRREGRTILYISHVLADVLRLADEIAVLRDGEVVRTGARDEFDIDTMIAAMVGRQIDQLHPIRTGKPADKVLMSVTGVTEPGIVKDISFDLHEGEILGLFGLMGSGRTELGRILFGLDPFRSGTIDMRGQPRRRRTARRSIAGGMAFVTEDRREEGLLMEASVTENMAHGVSEELLSQSGSGHGGSARVRRSVDEMIASLKIKCVNRGRLRSRACPAAISRSP